MRYLITGGAGFIGSHLADELVSRSDSDSVVILDNLSTGRYENVAHLDGNPRARILIGSILDERLLEECVHDCDAIFHLASAVGVKLVLERPVRSIETIVRGTDEVLALASRYRRPTLLTSTSEVYGKSKSIPFREDGDQVMGASDKQRWAYAAAKALEEFLALAHFRESKLAIIIARLFNTVGPRQTGRYGMVLPTFVKQALHGRPITVYGNGQQTRCFCHVGDVVAALADLMNCREAIGEIVNVGTQEEISIANLAEQVKATTGSSSAIDFIPYDEAYLEGFEDMDRRVPCLEKANRLISYKPTRSLEDCIRDTAEYVKTNDAGD